MRTEQEIFELVHTYLSNELTNAERIEFDLNLKKDTQLSIELENQILSNSALDFAFYSELKSKINSDIHSIPYHKPKPFWMFTAISSVLVLTTLGIYIHYLSPKNSVKENKIKITLASKSISKEANTSSKDNNTKSNIEEKNLLTFRKITKVSPFVIASERKNDSIKPSITSFEKINSTTNIIPYMYAPPSQEKENTRDQITCIGNLIIKSTAACEDTENGALSAELKGGNPTEFSIRELNVSSSKGDFKNLGAGLYTVIALDAKNCVFEKNILIEEKWCSKNSSFSFNPTYGDVWNIEYKANDEGKYTIFDNKNQLLKTGTFGVENIGWNGNDENGSSIAQGVFRALIEYKDGREETIQLTLIRN